VADCRHESLKYVGQQTTDEGVNSYYTCNACGEVLVVTPANRVFGVHGKQAASKDS
jgi:hypothetical protein